MFRNLVLLINENDNHKLLMSLLNISYIFIGHYLFKFYFLHIFLTFESYW